MTTYAPAPSVSGASPQQTAPLSASRRGGRATLIEAGTAVTVCAVAAAISATALSTPAPAPVHTVIVSPTFTAEQAAAAKKQACNAWAVASEVLAHAATAVADAPPGWRDPAKQEALGAEARMTLVETAYLRSNLTPAAPAEIRGPLHDYLVATSDQEDATMRMRGHARNDAIDRANEATDRANAACGMR